MKFFGFHITRERLWTIIFHLVLWSIWIGLPILNSLENDRMRQFSIRIIPVSLTNIPLFLLNSEWLIPQVFRKKGVPVYLLSLLALIAVFAAMQMVMKEWIIPPGLIRHHWDVFWAVVPVIFVTAISTGYGFINYLLRRERTLREAQQERLQSELSFLRSQISPHFIFNILNSIVYLIRTKNPQAEPVTIKLSELMRYLLYDSDHAQVSLGKELDYLKNYVELQKIRFEEDVEIRLNIEGDPGAHQVEPMLLIPFVENAFKHGVGLIDRPVIDISLKINERDLFFFVKNKIVPERPEDKDASSGIGLRNVRRRLELLHPGEHLLDFGAENDWFSVRLKLPFTQPN